MNHLMRRRRERQGQSLVEFALVVPVFFLLLFGFIDIGRYVYTVSAYGQAAREGARYGAVEQWSFTCPAATTPKTRINCTRDTALARLTPGAPTPDVIVTCATTNCRAGDIFTVRLQSKTGGFTFMTPIISTILGTPTVSTETKVTIQ